MWQPALTVLVSAVTAAVVTLVVEYLAKPRLEVRKDRIVETARTWRDLDSQIAALFSARAFAHDTTRSISWPQLREYLRELIKLLESCEQTALRVRSRGDMPVPAVLAWYRELLADILDTTAEGEFEPDPETIPRVLVALDHDLMRLQPSVWKHSRTSRYSLRELVQLARSRRVDDGYRCYQADSVVHDLRRRLDRDTG